MDESIKNVYGYVPENLSKYVEFSQKVQSDALVYWIKHAMDSKYSGGIIYWNIMDGWPQFADAVVDYYFKPKIGYLAIKKLIKEYYLGQIKKQ